MNAIQRFKKAIDYMAAKSFSGLETFDVGKMMADNLALYDQFGVGQLSYLKMLIPFICIQTKFKSAVKHRGGLIIMSDTYAKRIDFRKVEQRLIDIRADLELIEEVKCKKRINRHILVDLFGIPKWYRMLRKCGLDKNSTFFLIKRMQVCRNLYRQLVDEHILDDVKYVISQYDAHDVDNMICQSANKLGIPTITLQHGHFHRSQFIQEDVYRIGAPFEGFVSDYFFAWGNYTKREAVLNGINPNRIIITGSLKNKDVLALEGNHRLFAVILNGRYANDDNERLLKIADELAKKEKMQYIVRPHPTDKKDYVRIGLSSLFRVSDQKENIYDLASMVSFVICGNSTVVSEMISMQKPVFILRPMGSVDYYEQLNELRFSDVISLEELVIRFRTDPNGVQEIIRAYKSELFGSDEATSFYNKTIDWILNNEEHKEASIIKLSQY